VDGLTPREALNLLYQLKALCWESILKWQ
jgi:hypothetical protein